MKGEVAAARRALDTGELDDACDVMAAAGLRTLAKALRGCKLNIGKTPATNAAERDARYRAIKLEADRLCAEGMTRRQAFYELKRENSDLADKLFNIVRGKNPALRKK